MSVWNLNASWWPPPWAHQLAELRIDVHLPDTRIESELEALELRSAVWKPQCEALPRLAGLPLRLKVMVRVAGGEHFVYVVDVLSQRVVACVTMNRLSDLGHPANGHFRAPHTKVSMSHRRRGIASGVYRWWLDSGACLMTGARQSPAARGLWLAMSRHYPLSYVWLENKRLFPLGDVPPAGVLDRLNVRAVLLGQGATLDTCLAQWEQPGRQAPGGPPILPTTRVFRPRVPLVIGS